MPCVEGHEKFLRVDKIILQVCKGISLVSAVAMASIAVLATINVITSKIFRTSVPSANDWITYLLIPVVYLSLAHVQLDRGMVRVDVLTKHFPRIINNIIEFLGYVGCCALNLFLASRAFTLVITYLDTSKMSSTSTGAFPLWPFPFILALGMFLFALSNIWSIIRLFVLGSPEKETPKSGEGGVEK